MKTARKNISQARHRARRLAVQALYQWQLAGQDIQDIEDQFISDHVGEQTDLEYFRELIRQVPAQLDDIDGEIRQVLDRPLQEVDPVERAILRLGTYELRSRPDIPFRVVITEAVQLAKVFGAEQGHKYANSVLDKIARKIRAAEAAAIKPAGDHTQ